MFMFRWMFGLPMAALITVALFMMMAGLIKIDRGVDEARPLPKIEIFPKIVEKGPTGDINDKVRPIPDDPPETIIEPTTRGNLPDRVVTDPTRTIETGNPDTGQMAIPSPLIRHAPAYPDSCRSKGVSGAVLVQFDVTPEGNVVNARILEAPDRCFSRILRTVERWKYPPSYQDGRPIMRYGVVERFSFQLTE